ncbi:MAG TPA: anti-sigma factor [Actinophytocola sp.]|uniref:anti-sigma factor n=1 Tax=Actinophytocola sp. TaxID=1872138 RepID=UPI002DDD5DE4|nr:anti-sigma factor [Actinophytocola sp.]HEV2781040.1 anti-sigma factor [Actinophytocola sp.]
MSPDVHALTGAYALDAVTDLERAEFERHLAACPSCAQEVRELRETAVRLGTAAAAMPPPALKDRVLGDITRVRQLPPEVALVGPVVRGRWALRLTTAAAAVLLVAAAVLGVLLVQARQAADRSEQRAAQIASILEAGDAKVTTGESSRGGTATVLSSRSQGRALVLTDGMPPPDGGKVYQAWLLGDGDPKPAGLLAGERVEVTGLGQAASIGLTEEPAGGSQKPSMHPFVNVVI